MKRIPRRTIFTAENIFVIAMAVITLLLLISAVITHSKILLLSFGVALFIYLGYTLVRFVIMRKK